MSRGMDQQVVDLAAFAAGSMSKRERLEAYSSLSIFLQNVKSQITDQPDLAENFGNVMTAIQLSLWDADE